MIDQIGWHWHSATAWCLCDSLSRGWAWPSRLLLLYVHWAGAQSTITSYWAAVLARLTVRFWPPGRTFCSTAPQRIYSGLIRRDCWRLSRCWPRRSFSWNLSGRSPSRRWAIARPQRTENRRQTWRPPSLWSFSNWMRE